MARYYAQSGKGVRTGAGSPEYRRSGYRDIGKFQCIHWQGKKQKKTFNVSAMVAAALSGKEVLNYTTDFPDGKNRILYIDTEQSQNHCMIVMQRIMKLAELPANEDCARFYFLALRKFNPKERLAIIDDAISQIEGLGFCRD